MKIVGLLAIGVVCGATVSVDAQSAEQIRRMAVTGAQVAGATARIATDICEIDQKQIALYKERTRKAFAADPNFEGNWIIGWSNEQHTVDDIFKLKANSHDQYALQRSETCKRISAEMKL